MRRRARRLRRGRSREAGARSIQEMLEQEGAPTRRVPYLTMREEVELHRRLREASEREERTR